MEKTEKIASAVFIAVILLLCLVPSLGMAFFGPSEAGANEVLAQPPKLTDELGFNGAVLADTRQFLDERFFARQELITAGRRLSSFAFGTAGSREVEVGRLSPTLPAWGAFLTGSFFAPPTTSGSWRNTARVWT